MRVLFFAHLKEAVGCAETQLSCGDTDADGFWRALLAAHPGLARFRGAVRLARNSEYAAVGTRFNDADEVALIPPVSGG